MDAILANSGKALDLDPDLAEAHASRGLALSVSQRYREAEQEFEHAIVSNPNLFEAHYFYARTCYAQGKLEKAAHHYDRAAETKPDDYQSAILLMQVYHSLGQQQKERDAARRGVERAERELTKNPENPRPAYLGANALAFLGETERAKEWSARAQAIDPDDILTQYNLACLHCYFGELEPAINLLERLLPAPTTKPWRGFGRIPISNHFTVIPDGRKC